MEWEGGGDAGSGQGQVCRHRGQYDRRPEQPRSALRGMKGHVVKRWVGPPGAGGGAACVWSHRSSQETEELGWNNAQPEDSGNPKVPPLVWELWLWAGLRLAAIKGPRGLLPARRLGAQPTLVFVSLESVLIKERVNPAGPDFLVQLLQRALTGFSLLPLRGHTLPTADSD